ncbi:winged helix-turn-helix domain-containing protein [Roseomonas sp. E05]|uniref:winged helix-turn-helix domain-containing protein n=1 Tax=Roseomonas sp. E05 TaxID=3046310 RepID=UPI0024B8BAA0|nr:winged helix-turn-helix domain-containing protein [Roseomonas sp. E05]MDJ0391125.1 winged helix-turn-helix domain-containing protein [Roseomonas sp. E05]
MPVPDYQTLMLPVLRIAAEGETRVPQMAERIANDFALTDTERDEMLPSGRQRLLHNRIHWAKFYLTKAGLIESPGRGRFLASGSGYALLARNPAAIDVDLLKTYPAFLAFYNGNGGGVGQEEQPVAKAATASEATPEEQIDAAHSLIHSALKADLLQRVLGGGDDFLI